MEAKCRLCTFHLNRRWFGIAVERVQEVMPAPSVTPVPLAPRGVAGLVNLRGQIVTVIDLWHGLGFRERPATGLPAMVMVRSENTLVGLLVDEISEVVAAPEETFEAAPVNLSVESQELVPKVCKLPRHLLHVLDLDRVLRSDGEEDPSWEYFEGSWTLRRLNLQESTFPSEEVCRCVEERREPASGCCCLC
jgi:purine-binding chemotaxis protein CheW